MREKKVSTTTTKKIINIKRKQFNLLPSSLIASIACYLDTNSFVSFSKINVNRWIAINCHKTLKPINVVSEIWLIKFKSNYGFQFEEHQMNKIDQFRMVKKLSLTLPELIEF